LPFHILRDFSARFFFNNYRSKCQQLSEVDVDTTDVLSHQYFISLKEKYACHLQWLDNKNLLNSANEIISLPYLSIIDKHPSLKISEPREYVSFAPYYWLDEDVPVMSKSKVKPTKKDGQANPFLSQRSDKPKLAQLCGRTHLLALAFLKTKNISYLHYIEKQLNIWFVEDDTRMFAHLKRAQIFPWSGKKRGFGIIDARWLILLIDALAMIKPEKESDNLLINKVCHWLLRFCDWLLKSFSGISELSRRNNRGSWVDALLCYIALAVNRTDLALHISSFSLSNRVTKQLSDDGLQPLELVRGMPVSYSLYNIFPVLYLAEISAQLEQHNVTCSNVMRLENSTKDLIKLIDGREEGNIESIDYKSTFDLNLYYPYSFEQIKYFPAVMPFTHNRLN